MGEKLSDNMRECLAYVGNDWAPLPWHIHIFTPRVRDGLLKRALIEIRYQPQKSETAARKTEAGKAVFHG